MADLGAIGRHSDGAVRVQLLDVTQGWNITVNPPRAILTSDYRYRAPPRREQWKQLAGTVVDADENPIACEVRAIERATGRWIASTISDAVTGGYAMLVPFAVEVQMVCLDDDDGTLRNDLILRTIPVSL